MAKRTKETKRRFKGSVSRNAAKQSRKAQFSHLNLPKGIGVFEIEPKTRVTLDILPYTVTDPNHPDRDDEYEIAIPGTLWYKRPYWVHRGIGPNNETVLCLQSFGQKCPICEHRAGLLREGADWQDETVRALKNSMRNLYAVVPRGSKKFEETVHIWDMSQFLFQDKLNEEIQENDEYETFPDPEEGFSLQIRFGESQLGTNRFAETSRIDFKSRSPLPDSLLDEVPALDDILEQVSRETLEAIFFGGLSQDEAEDDEDAPRRRKKATSHRTPAPADEDDDEDDEVEDEDEEEEPWEDEDDEEEEPWEDEEEDEGDEEEEEAPAPARRSRQSASAAKASAKAPAKAAAKAPAKARGRATSKASGKCPHKHAFGVDCDKHDECGICEMWEECADAAESA